MKMFQKFFGRLIASATGTVKVGWLLDASEAEFIYGAPERVRNDETTCRHAKSASRCPAIIDMEARYFSIPCPFDLNVRIEKDGKGQWALRNLDGDRSAVRQNLMRKQMTIVKADEWRHPDRPMLQISAPYRFVTDDTVYLTQCHPFMAYPKQPWPGLVFGGRMPIHIWPRSLMWAFEWYDTDKPLMFKRGDPWFYVYLESEKPDRKVKLVEAEMTADLQRHIKGMSGVPGYVNNTFSLFKIARERRPRQLLQEK